MIGPRVLWMARDERCPEDPHTCSGRHLVEHAEQFGVGVEDLLAPLPVLEQVGNVHHVERFGAAHEGNRGQAEIGEIDGAELHSGKQLGDVAELAVSVDGNGVAAGAFRLDDLLEAVQRLVPGAVHKRDRRNLELLCLGSGDSGHADDGTSAAEKRPTHQGPAVDPVRHSVFLRGMGGVRCPDPVFMIAVVLPGADPSLSRVKSQVGAALRRRMPAAPSELPMDWRRAGDRRAEARQMWREERAEMDGLEVRPSEGDA